MPWLRHGGTMLALSRLSQKDLLSAAEFRTIDRRLPLPAQSGASVAIRRGSSDASRFAGGAARGWICWRKKMRRLQQLGDSPSGEKLLQELNAHLEAVQEIYERVIHAQRPIYYSLPPAVAPQIEAPEVVEPTSSNLIRFSG